MSHGSKSKRAQGSIGAGTTPGRVFKGMKMPGHMGAERVKIRKLEVRAHKRGEVGSLNGSILPPDLMASLALPNPSLFGIQVIKVDLELGAILIKGGVPGKPGNILEICPAKIVGVNV